MTLPQLLYKSRNTCINNEKSAAFSKLDCGYALAVHNQYRLICRQTEREREGGTAKEN
jgi:hypothetical protein